jgi:hypothetical protein
MRNLNQLGAGGIQKPEAGSWKGFDEYRGASHCRDYADPLNRGRYRRMALYPWEASANGVPEDTNLGWM